MREFIIETLIDITESKQYRKTQDNEIGYHQQQNFSMLLQTIGMRANPLNFRSPDIKTVDVSKKFGTAFAGRQRVWTFRFFIEYDGAYTDINGDETALLKDDLNFIPVSVGLEETADIVPAMFNIKSIEDCNTVISVVSDK